MEMVVDVNRMRMRCKHMDDVSLHRYMYIHTYLHTYHKHSDFLVAMISVGLARLGLAQARPKYYIYIIIILHSYYTAHA